MLTAIEIKGLLEPALLDGYSVSVTVDGRVRVKTPYSYPDGQLIEVYVKPESYQYVVSDDRNTAKNFTERTGQERLGDEEKFDGDDCTRRLCVDFTLKGEVRGLPTDAADIAEAVTDAAAACHAMAAQWARRQ